MQEAQEREEKEAQEAQEREAQEAREMEDREARDRNVEQQHRPGKLDSSRNSGKNAR
jgi:hypothetical protein